LPQAHPFQVNDHGTFIRSFAFATLQYL